MDRSELYALNDYKREELKKRLKPITDWSELDYQERIFHEDDNNIYNENIFVSYNKEQDVVEYGTVGGMYNISAKGWYYYDTTIVNEVEEYWTPKLYIITPVDQSDDGEFIIACNDNHVYSCFLEKHKEIPREELTFEEFKEFYYIELVKEVDGFNIKCI